MAEDRLRVNANVNDALGSALRNSDEGLSSVPKLLKRALLEETWREFVTRLGDHVLHETFEQFVKAPPMAGLGADVDLVKRIAATDAEAADLVDAALAGRQGRRTDLGNNVPEVGRPEGNSQAKALRRLRKDAPELHAEVVAGRISAHAAMVQAGFRPKTVSVPVGRPDAVAEALRRHMSPGDLARLVSLLAENGSEP